MTDAIDSGVISAKEVKGLTAWASGYLKKREFPAVDSLLQFADGVLLINLLELTFKTELPRYTARPKLPIQKLENVSVACDFIISEKIMMLGLDPHDIVAKKEKQIVIALWNILRTVLLRGLGQDDDNNGKMTFRERLLKYFSENFPNLQITDFWKCWQDGVAFCHVVNRLCPGKIDVKSLKAKNKQANLQEAFDIAQWELGIPRMLEPDEMQSKASNEKACMNYISMLLSAAQSAEQQNAKDAEAERIKQRLKDMQNDAAKMQEEKDRLEREQAEQAAEKERLRAEMEAATSKSDAERAAMNAKFDELQRQMAQAAAEREALAAAKAAMEQESQSDRASLLEEIERLKGDIISLNSQLYQAHNELEEVVVRVAKDRSVKLEEERNRGTVTRERSLSTKIRTTQREAKTATEYLDDMSVKDGMLMRRRPGATFNKDRFKEVWFSLKGNKLMYKRKNGVVNGEFPLGLYEPAYIVDENAENGGKRKTTIDDNLNAEPNKERFTFRLEPRPDEKKKKKNKNMFVELQARECDEQDKRDCNAATRRWMWEINRRIAIHDYLRMLDETNETGCRELLDYVTDDNNDTMSITDKVVGASSFQALFPALLQRQSLRTISFKNAEVNDKVCGLIAQVVKENEHIKTVSLSGNLITSVGVKELVCALRRNISVTKLDLSNNKLRDDGVKVLSQVFSDHTNLEAVNLSGNGITDEGVTHFVDGLLKSTKENNGSVHYLPHIDLSYNLVGDEGCEQLKRLCGLNNTILSINLESNKIADAGGVALAGCITGDGADLDTLNVAGNDLAAKGVMALAAAIKDSDGEVQVDISDNKLISRKGYAAILEMPCNMEFVLLKFRKLIADESTVKHQRQATMNDRSMSFSGFKPVEDKTQPRPSIIPAGTKLPEFSEEDDSDDDDDDATARPTTAIQEETGDFGESDDDDGIPMPAVPPTDSDDDSDDNPKPPAPGADFSSDSD